MSSPRFQIDNLRLETGFIDGEGPEAGMVIATRTEPRVIEIDGTRIVAVHDRPQPGVPVLDGGGLLALPAMRDMHIHLDKTFHGGPWRAPLPKVGRTITDMIAQEERLLPELLPQSRQRAEGLIELLLSQGTTFARSHCNIEPVSGLRSLEHLMQALASYRDVFDCHIVAFPQHGLLRSAVAPLMHEAMAMGASHVGGLDPSLVDGAPEASIDAMFAIALDHDRPVDIHLHEPGPEGLAAIGYMLDCLEAEPRLQGRLTISHGFALARLDPGHVRDLGVRMAALGVDLASSIPIGRGMMPLDLLVQAGVRVMAGTDSVIDHWSPFGTGDMLDKAQLWARLYQGADECSLARSLALVTGGVTPLDAHGNLAWPRPGDEASLVLVDASCSAEAVARRSPRKMSFHRGRLAWGQMPGSRH